MEPNVKLILHDEDKERREISVWSHVMINASPYFRALLTGKFREGRILQQDGTLEVELLDIDEGAMTILCDIWHLKSSRVPVTNISSDTLYEIALLVDRFACVEAVQPWPKIWAEQHQIQSEIAGITSMDVDDLEKWIHICCHLGYDHEFHSLTSELLQRATRKDILTEASEYFLGLFSSLQEAITQRRQTCVHEFRQLCMELVGNLENGQSCRLKGSGWVAENFNCSSIQLGNAILALRANIGPDWQCEENWTRSINDIYNALQCVGDKLRGPSRLTGNYNGFRMDHASCVQSGQFLEQLKPIYEAAITRLPFEEFGDMAYRTLRTAAVAMK